MRTLVLLAAVVLLLALLGWITFSSGPGRSSINLETNEIRNDTQKAVEAGAGLLDDAGKAMGQPDISAESESHQPTDSDSRQEPISTSRTSATSE